MRIDSLSRMVLKEALQGSNPRTFVGFDEFVSFKKIDMESRNFSKTA